MPQQISITWHLTPKFSPEDLGQILHEELGLKEEPPPQDVLRRWKFGDITVHLYRTRLLVQLVKTEFTLTVVKRLQPYEGLTVDDLNAQKIAALLPVGQNSLVCPQCKMPTIEVKAEVSGLSATFKTSCGHSITFEPPVMMFSNRLLPDINILVGNNLSLFLKLGFFKRFEVALPDFLLHAIDQFLGKKKAAGAGHEIEKLKALAAKDEIALIWFEVGEKKYLGPENFEQREDDFILEQAKLTNSILLTADKNLSQKATLQQRPVVYLEPRIISQLKALVGGEEPSTSEVPP